MHLLVYALGPYIKPKTRAVSEQQLVVDTQIWPGHPAQDLGHALVGLGEAIYLRAQLLPSGA